MKELLIIAFNEAYDKLCSFVPKTKEIQKVLNIENLSLLQLNNKIKYIDFCFGKTWGLYHVTISPFYLNIAQQEGYNNFTKHIINIKTCIL